MRHFQFAPNARIPAEAFPPRAEQYIVFYVRGGEFIRTNRNGGALERSAPIIIGQATQLVYRHTTPEFLIIQVPFFPGALFQLTGIPFHELRDNSVALESLYPKEAKEINQKLQDATDYQQMIKFVDDFLTDLFAKKARIEERPFDRMLPHLWQPQPAVSIDQLADQVCLSIRQLERLSQNYFGVSPKTMMRIARFSASLIMRTKHPEYSWLDVAVACGYEDYQHLVRDYREFTGFLPNQLLEFDKRGPVRALVLR